MLWVVIMVAIAVVGLVMVVCYARWLWHKASDLMAEVSVVMDRLGQLGELLGRIQPLESPGGYAGAGYLRDPDQVGDAVGEDDQSDDEADDEDDDWAAEARALRLHREATESSLSAPGARRAKESETTTAT